MEDESEDVAMGKLIEETTYLSRSDKYQQIELGPIKVDFYDHKNQVIHEVKKSSKFHETHVWQLKYYLFILENNGIEGATGVLEYPKERKTEEVCLEPGDRERIRDIRKEIEAIVQSGDCPGVINQPRCKRCSYFDFCYASDEV